MKTWLIIGVAALMGIMPAMAKKPATPLSYNLTFPNESTASSRYGNLDYGLRIQVNTDVDENRLINKSELNSKDAAKFPKVYFSNTLRQGAEEFLDNYFNDLGFQVGTDPESDFILKVRITNCNLRIREYDEKHRRGSSSAAMVLTWELLNSDRDIVIDGVTCTGRATTDNFYRLAFPLTEAYAKALSGIDTDRIASQLKIAKSARQEKNKQVTGSGGTALEHTVIRWNIVSRPAGADVYWRVISSTPDVANTNSNYVGTTPYESTETFDIKGLTYNNSGNVQIEVNCERPGYLSQKRRFNLRQVIDQKEISAKFNLVKEDSEE